MGDIDPPGPAIKKKAPSSPEPVIETAKDLGFGDYAKVRRLHVASRKEAKDALNRQIEREKKALYERQREERKKIFTGSWKGRGVALNALRSVLAAKQARERGEIQDRIKTLRKQFSKESLSCFFPDFEEWVRKTRGNQVADRYLHSGKN